MTSGVGGGAFGPSGEENEIPDFFAGGEDSVVRLARLELSLNGNEVQLKALTINQFIRNWRQNAV